MHEVEVRVRWRIGHRLMNYDGACKNCHGEGVTGIFVFAGEITRKDDILLDFGKVKKEIKDWVNANWDHAMVLNEKDTDFIEFLKSKNQKVFVLSSNPTSEKMAEYLYKLFKQRGYPIKKVGIVESFEDSIAWYYDK